MNVKKVSVIVPCYQGEDYISKCIDSLLKQSLEELEIVLVNDGSRDKTLKMMKDYEKKYPEKIMVVDLKKNTGLGNARNVGVQRANGEYIGFVDSDDYVDKEMFEEMYKKGKEENSDVVECDVLWEYPDHVRNDVGREYTSNKQMLKDIRVMACNKIYKKEFLNKVRPKFAVGLRYEDILFTYQYVPFVKNISYIRIPYYHYIQRETSLANHQTKKVGDIYPVLNKVLDYYKEKKLYKTYEKELEYLYTRYILGSSFKRATKIKEKKDRRMVLEEGWYLLNKNFPNWKKNEYLKEKNKKNNYFRRMNHFFYQLSAFIHRVFL